MLALVVATAVLGWALAVLFFVRSYRHVCPIEPATKAVLVNSAGLPESCRALRGVPPKTYSRPHGSLPATVYQRIGTAILYQATAPRQPQ